jgi:hypothetical protein
MKTKFFIFILVVFGFKASLPGQVTALPPGSVVAGLTLEEWSAQWWKWALAFPISKSPLYDTNRHAPFAHSAQPDPVFFIAGAITTTPGLHFVTREVTIRSDAHVFFPIVNFTAENVGRAVSLSPQELRDEAVVLTSLVTEAHASVDGVEIPCDRILRLLAPVFSYTIPDVPDNLFRFFGLDFSGIADPAVSDGYWVMLAPLPPGQHVVQFRGAVGPPHNVVHDITYHFTVRQPTLLEKLADLVNSVEGAGLSAKREQPLLTSLEAARASFDRKHLRAGINQLAAFQKKVRTQLGKDNPDLAEELVRAAQAIIDRAKKESK